MPVATARLQRIPSAVRRASHVSIATGCAVGVLLLLCLTAVLTLRPAGGQKQGGEERGANERNERILAVVAKIEPVPNLPSLVELSPTFLDPNYRRLVNTKSDKMDLVRAENSQLLLGTIARSAHSDVVKVLSDPSASARAQTKKITVTATGFCRHKTGFLPRATCKYTEEIEILGKQTTQQGDTLLARFTRPDLSKYTFQTFCKGDQCPVTLPEESFKQIMTAGRRLLEQPSRGGFGLIKNHEKGDTEGLICLEHFCFEGDANCDSPSPLNSTHCEVVSNGGCIKPACSHYLDLSLEGGLSELIKLALSVPVSMRHVAAERLGFSSKPASSEQSPKRKLQEVTFKGGPSGVCSSPLTTDELAAGIGIQIGWDGTTKNFQKCLITDNGPPTCYLQCLCDRDCDSFDRDNGVNHGKCVAQPGSDVAFQSSDNPYGCPICPPLLTVEYVNTCDCFPKSATIRLAGGQRVAISDVKMGDKVESVADDGSIMYSDVYSLFHSVADRNTTYLTITSEDGDTISMTGDHFLYATPKTSATSLSPRHWQAVPAGTVQAGDFIWTSDNGTLRASRVASVRESVMEGLYAPGTLTGRVIVDGVVASSYSTVVGSAEATHRVLWPLRLCYRLVPGLMIWAQGEGGLTEYWSWAFPMWRMLVSLQAYALSSVGSALIVATMSQVALRRLSQAGIVVL